MRMIVHKMMKQMKRKKRKKRRNRMKRNKNEKKEKKETNKKKQHKNQKCREDSSEYQLLQGRAVAKFVRHKEQTVLELQIVPAGF
jgi:hypothetical protein